jgi:hypothetical protein
LAWLTKVNSVANLRVEIEDVTPDYTCFALQGPRAIEILEALTGEPFADMRFSRWRKVPILGVETIIARQGVTGEVGYEFLMPTASGKGHELWAAIRDIGHDFGLRELGFKAQLVGHTETGIATVVRDFMPDRFRGRRGRSSHACGPRPKNSTRWTGISTSSSARPPNSAGSTPSTWSTNFTDARRWPAKPMPADQRGASSA